MLEIFLVAACHALSTDFPVRPQSNAALSTSEVASVSELVVQEQAVTIEYIALMRQIDQAWTGGEIFFAGAAPDTGCAASTCDTPSEGQCTCRRVRSIEICTQEKADCVQVYPCADYQCSSYCDVPAYAIVYDATGTSLCIDKEMTATIVCAGANSFYSRYRCKENQYNEFCECSGVFLGTFPCEFYEITRYLCGIR